MLRIRPHQMRILAQRGAERFLATLSGHLRDNRVGGAHLLADAALHDRVAAAVAVARRRGMAQHPAIAGYVNLMFLIGPRFDEHPAVRRIIEHPGAEPDRFVEQMLRLVPPEAWREAQRYDPSWDHLLSARALSATPPERT